MHYKKRMIFHDNFFVQFDRENKKDIKMFAGALMLPLGHDACVCGWVKAQQTNSSILQKCPVDVSCFQSCAMQQGPAACLLSTSYTQNVHTHKQKYFCCDSLEVERLTSSGCYARHPKLVPSSVFPIQAS